MRRLLRQGMHLRRILPSLLALLLSLLPDAQAASPRGKPPPDPTRDRMLITAGFLSAHPDLRYRLLGLESMKRSRPEEAFGYFRRAAHYADKPSQGMVAEMLWNGQGTPRDRTLGYAWMDLAAERGYAGFSGLRERYWAQLDEAERRRAIEQGQAVYAQYGDAVAQPRMASVLRKRRMRMTGSRTGMAVGLQILVPGPAGLQQIDGTQFYDERYWDPKRYQAWHDAMWARPRIGKVDVGEMEDVSVPLQQRRSRIPARVPQVDAPEPEPPSH